LPTRPLNAVSSGAFKDAEAVGGWEGVATPALPAAAYKRAGSGAERPSRQYDWFDSAFDAGHVRKVKKPKVEGEAPMRRTQPAVTAPNSLPGKRGHRHQRERW
tara:strand:- start:149 stop:457 length:309 start_codon:yes stop_codon:yes gene_type:complete